MKYPHGNGSKEDFYNKYYSASGFGERRSSTYLHEAEDINAKTGGNTDLGDPIRAIADYELDYYHMNKHSGNAYGKHFVYHINTPFGDRWIQHEHIQADPPILIKTKGKEGDIIAYTGNTGTTYAHDHMAVYKVDPISIGGIDIVVGDEFSLNEWWESPFKFLDKLNESEVNMSELSECLKQHTELVDKCNKLESQLVDATKRADEMDGQVKSFKAFIDTLGELLDCAHEQSAIMGAVNGLVHIENQLENAQNQIIEQKLKHDDELKLMGTRADQLQKAMEDMEVKYKAEIDQLKSQITTLQNKVESMQTSTKQLNSIQKLIAKLIKSFGGK